jgi:hypothetical protein
MMFWKSWFSAEKSIKLDAKTSQILDLEERKKALEIDIAQLKLKLDTERQEQELKQKEIAHLHSMEMKQAQKEFEEKERVFNAEMQRMKMHLQEDTQREKDRAKKSLDELKVSLESKHETSLLELKTLAKLEGQQQAAQLKVDKEREIQKLEAKYQEEISALKTAHAEQLSELKSTYAKDNYEAMQRVLEEATLKGTDSSRFFQEALLKLTDKAFDKPMPSIAQITTGISEAK